MKKIVLYLIKVYRWYSGSFWYFAPVFLIYPVCRFHPTCAEYGHDVIDEYGLRRGVPLMLKRIIRCNPLTKI